MEYDDGRAEKQSEEKSEGKATHKEIWKKEKIEKYGRKTLKKYVIAYAFMIIVEC